MKTKREVIRVKYKGARGAGGTKPWTVRTGTGSWFFATKREAVAHGRDIARRRYRNGRLVQLVIHKRDGRFQTEHTYGRDPKRSKG